MRLVCSTRARQQLPARYPGGQAARQFPQQLVRRMMYQQLIDFLDMPDPQVQQRQRPGLRPRCGHRGFQAAPQRGPVGQAGQAVLIGQAQQRRLRLARLAAHTQVVYAVGEIGSQLFQQRHFFPVEGVGLLRGHTSAPRTASPKRSGKAVTEA